MKKKELIHFITDSAIFAAVGFILDFVQGIICDFLPFWPNGGSVGIAMCAVFVISYKHGLKALFVGFIIGILSMMGGVWISPFADNFFKTLVQLGLDYFLAWTVVGISGAFCGLIKKAKTNKAKIGFVCLASFIGGFARYVCHVLAGMLFWPVDDVTSQFAFAVGYNATYMLPSIILCCVVMSILVIKAPKLFAKEEKTNE